MLKISGPTVNSTNLELVNLATYKSFMKIDPLATGDDTLIGLALNAANRGVYRLLGNRFLKDVALHDCLISGTGTTWQKLPQWPIVSVTSIERGYVNGNDPGTDFIVDQTVASTDYYADKEHGRLVAISGWIWTRGYNNFRIKWNAGLSPIPDDLIEAICEWAGVMVVRAKTGRWDAIQLTKNTESTLYERTDLPPRAKRTIMDYGRVTMGIG